MYSQTDHLNLGLELDLSPYCISILKPFNCHNCPILEAPFVNVSETAFSEYVFAAEIVCSNLKFSELKPLQVSQAYFFSILLWIFWRYYLSVGLYEEN